MHYIEISQVLLQLALMATPADINHDGCVDLADYASLQNQMVADDCNRNTAPVEMVLVPGGGIGPDYDFLIGKYEITNEQFVTFLNDAQADGGRTIRGSGLNFGDGGYVTQVGTNFRLFAAYSSGCISYNATKALGERFEVEEALAQYSATGMSWLGAAKFCNWLTVSSGLDAGDVCYVEPDFRPMSIAAAIWSVRDLNLLERRRLVDNCRGFRLPMDFTGIESGFVHAVPGSFNEWYKAAAYDPNAPATIRRGDHDEYIPAYHWKYGFGRDTISPGDCHFEGIRTGVGCTYYRPVGFFNGTNFVDANNRTNPNSNAFGVFDMSGNVWEFVQDFAVSPSARAIRGGSIGGVQEVACSVRGFRTLQVDTNNTGFRVLQIP